jgi:hypothetical protein
MVDECESRSARKQQAVKGESSFAGASAKPGRTATHYRLGLTMQLTVNALPAWLTSEPNFAQQCGEPRIRAKADEYLVYFDQRQHVIACLIGFL